VNSPRWYDQIEDYFKSRDNETADVDDAAIGKEISENYWELKPQSPAQMTLSRLLHSTGLERN